MIIHTLINGMVIIYFMINSLKMGWGQVFFGKKTNCDIRVCVSNYDLLSVKCDKNNYVVLLKSSPGTTIVLDSIASYYVPNYLFPPQPPFSTIWSQFLMGWFWPYSLTTTLSTDPTHPAPGSSIHLYIARFPLSLLWPHFYSWTYDAPSPY